MVLHERFKEADWLLFSDELSLPVPVPGIVQAALAFGVALKDNSKEEILTALQCASRKERFICITSVTCCSQATVPPPHSSYHQR